MISTARQQARSEIAGPGDQLTGIQRLEAWDEVRDSASNPLDAQRLAALSPVGIAGGHNATEHLTEAAVDVVHRVASDPGRLTRTWAEQAIGQLGAATYTELVGVTAIIMVLDRFDLASKGQLGDLPDPIAGEPTRLVPDDVGDVGAWVPQTVGPSRANVSRTLSGVPRTNITWRALVDSHYSRGEEFVNLQWNRELSRPQTELVAARVTSLSECFY